MHTFISGTILDHTTSKARIFRLSMIDTRIKIAIFYAIENILNILMKNSNSGVLLGLHEHI